MNEVQILEYECRFCEDITYWVYLSTRMSKGSYYDLYRCKCGRTKDFERHKINMDEKNG